MVSLISRSDLQVKIEEEIFEACKRWVNEKIKIRSQSMYELLEQVRLAVVKPDYIANVIVTFPDCEFSPECQKLINNAALYHLSQ